MVFVMTPFNFNSGKPLFWNLMGTAVWLVLSRMPKKVHTFGLLAPCVGASVRQGSEVAGTQCWQLTTYNQILAIFMESTMQGSFESYLEYATPRQSQEADMCPVLSDSSAVREEMLLTGSETRGHVQLCGKIWWLGGETWDLRVRVSRQTQGDDGSTCAQRRGNGRKSNTTSASGDPLRAVAWAVNGCGGNGTNLNITTDLRPTWMLFSVTYIVSGHKEEGSVETAEREGRGEVMFGADASTAEF